MSQRDETASDVHGPRQRAGSLRINAQRCWNCVTRCEARGRLPPPLTNMSTPRYGKQCLATFMARRQLPSLRGTEALMGAYQDLSRLHVVPQAVSNSDAHLRAASKSPWVAAKKRRSSKYVCKVAPGTRELTWSSIAAEAKFVNKQARGQPCGTPQALGPLKM